MTLSEGGLSLEAPLRVEQGDTLHMRILPHRKGRSVAVEGIAWNDRPSRSRAGRLRLIGVVVSDPPCEFLELLSEVERRNAPRDRTAGRPQTRPAPAPPTRPAPTAPTRPAPASHEDLPRSRAPMPPPKREAEENLPGFRVRLKQAGGPRTRILRIQATSVADAEERARAEIRAMAAGGVSWEILDVTGS